MWLLIVGNPVDGFTYYGPYTSSEDAVRAAEQSCDGDWWIATLYPHEQLEGAR